MQEKNKTYAIYGVDPSSNNREYVEYARIQATDIFDARQKWEQQTNGHSIPCYIFPVVTDDAGNVDGIALMEFATIIARLKAKAAKSRKGKVDEKTARQDARKANNNAEKTLERNYIQTFFNAVNQSPDVQDTISDCYTEILQAIRDGKDIYYQFLEGMRAIDTHNNENRHWNRVTAKYFAEVYLNRGVAVVDTQRALNRELQLLEKFLSPTQIRILRYICHGHSNRQIQFIMDYKTVGTVTTHIQRIREKIRANFPTVDDFVHYVCTVYNDDNGDDNGDGGLMQISY